MDSVSDWVSDQYIAHITVHTCSNLNKVTFKMAWHAVALHDADPLVFPDLADDHLHLGHFAFDFGKMPMSGRYKAKTARDRYIRYCYLQ